MKKVLYSRGTKVFAFIVFFILVFVGTYKISELVPQYYAIDKMEYGDGDITKNNYRAFDYMFSLMDLDCNTGRSTEDDSNGFLNDNLIDNFKYYACDESGLYSNVPEDEAQTLKENIDAFLATGNRSNIENYITDGAMLLINYGGTLKIYHNYKTGYYFNDVTDNRDFYIFLEPTQSYLTEVQEKIDDSNARYVLLKDNLKNDFISLFWIPLSILILIVYFFAVAGRNGEDDEVHTIFLDNVFEEITGVVGGIIFLIFLAGTIISVLELEDGSNFMLSLLSASCACGTVGAFLGVFLSYARNLKRHEFIKRSFILNLLRKAWVSVSKDVVKLKNAAKPTVMAVVTTGIYALLMILVDIEFFELVFTIVFFVLFIRYIAGFDDLEKAIREFASGNIDYKTNNMQSGVMGDLCREIDKMGESMNLALEKQLAAERMKTQLVTNVSHDLKTPLTSIINYSELLGNMELSEENAEEYVKIIKSKALRLKTLTSDLFEISKVQSGSETVNMEDIDAGVLIKQSLGELDEEIKNSNLDFRTKIEEGCCIKGDGEKLSRVLENIFVNAVKYSLPGTRVWAECGKKEDKVVIEVKNISSYPLDFDVSQICERFVRGDESRSTEGNGLGLAIAKCYTEAMGGKFEVVTDGDLFKVIICFG